MPLSFVWFEQPNEFGLILQGCCCILLAMTRCAPQTFGGVVALMLDHHAGMCPEMGHGLAPIGNTTATLLMHCILALSPPSSPPLFCFALTGER